MGITKALEMCLTGDTVSGNEAHKLGLVNAAVPANYVVQAAEDLANRILKGAPMSVAFIKEAIKKGIELPLEEGLRLEADLSALIGMTEDSEEGRAHSPKSGAGVERKIDKGVRFRVSGFDLESNIEIEGRE